MYFSEWIKSKAGSRRNNNLLKILGQVWNTPEISRYELAANLDMTKVSMGKNIERLLNMGYIEEGESKPGNGGRRPIPLYLKSSLFYSVGISLSSYKYSIMLLDARSNVVKEITKITNNMDVREKLDLLFEMLDTILEVLEFPQHLAGFGISLPGVFNPEDGIIRSSAVFADGSDIPLKKLIEDRYKKPCSLMNISHLLALLEKKFGKAQDMHTFIRLESGFGGGIYMNGKLCRGWQNQSGEFGYMQIDSQGPVNVDGRVGTLQQLAAPHVITDKIEDIIKQGGDTKVKKYLIEGHKKVTITMLAKAINDGDKLCEQLMLEAFDIIAKAIVNIAYIFNPQAIFLDPWTAECPQCTIDVIKRKMTHYGVSNWELSTEVKSAKFSSEDSALGAAIFAVEKIFSVNI